MTKQRLDLAMVARGLVPTRSQAENYIKLGNVTVSGQFVTKSGIFVADTTEIVLTAPEQYVSRAALKLASIAETFKLDFKDKVVLDVGSSTGGFTDFALRHGAKGVIAVEVGKDQLHPKLRSDSRIDLREKTDIRDVKQLSPKPDITLIDVSFISLREVLPAVALLTDRHALVVAMVKPQFEATAASFKHKGVIKNDRMRREIMKGFETWVTNSFVIEGKADSGVTGSRGNLERFYKLHKI